jgi:curved DNA-binding protein
MENFGKMGQRFSSKMSAKFRDYYQTLGVSKSASAAEIKTAFRKLARQHHPDTAKDKKQAEEKFKEINEAYEVLGDPEKRKRYDDFGTDWQHGSQAGGGIPRRGGFRPAPGPQGSDDDFSFGGTGFSDFFEQMFGGRRGGFGGIPQRGQDVEADIMVTLEEALHGSTRQVSFRRGTSKKLETYTVKIPKGIRDGQRIRLAGQGGTGAGGAGAGDLFLRIKFQRHPDFEIEGANLVYELDLPAWDAVLGCSVTVPTLGGRVKLKIPAGTQSGKKFRLTGMGLPEGATSRGDLYAVVGISIPENPSPEEKALWEKIEALNPK